VSIALHVSYQSSWLTVETTGKFFIDLLNPKEFRPPQVAKLLQITAIFPIAKVKMAELILIKQWPTALFKKLVIYTLHTLPGSTINFFCE
jgi:hypothetical protein